MLTNDQKEELHHQLLALDSNLFSQVDMLRQYVVAKLYIFNIREQAQV